MTDDDTADEGFALDDTRIHLGRGATAVPLPGFEWSPASLASYEERFAADGDDGRLVTIEPQTASWDTWERHPAGAEVVVVLAGRVDLIQRLGDGERRVRLRPGRAAVNPPGVWHTADVHEPGRALFITPGRGTEHTPR
jgi:uncharacterized cupin superfamily protein